MFKKICAMITANHYRYFTWFILAALVVLSVIVLYTARPAQASGNAEYVPQQTA